MEGFNRDNRFESWELVGDIHDSCESTGLKEKEGDIRMGKAGGSMLSVDRVILSEHDSHIFCGATLVQYSKAG